jgi:excisionase family DNA binding protein
MTEHGLAQAIENLAQAVQTVPVGELPALLGQVERVKALGWSRMLTGPVSMTGEAEELLTMAEAARRLSIPTSRAYELARQKKLPAVKIGKYVRVSAQALAAYQAQLPKA